MVGVSSACLYPQMTEKSLQALASNGIANVEVFFNSPTELTLSFAKILKEICDEYGVKVLSIHPYTSFAESFLFFNIYERRQRDAFEIYDNYFEVAAFLGAKVFNFHGQKKECPVPVKEYAKTYSQLFNLAKKHNVIFSQENVCRNVCGFTQYVKDLKKELGNEVAFTLDIKQANRAGVSPFEMAGVMSDKIALVHINDYTAEQDCLLPLAGTFPTSDFLKTLKGYSYNGDFIIEVYSRNFKNINNIVDSKRRLEYEMSILRI